MLKDLQNTLFDKFKSINSEFNEKGIFWFPHSGTLLGIKRHEGDFIPWDDDIDMAMPYSVYFKRRSEINQIAKNNGFQFRGILENNHHTVAKFISNNKYKFNIEGKEIETKIFIDIMLTIPRELIGKKSCARKLSGLPPRILDMYLKEPKIKTIGARIFIPVWLMKKVFLRKVNKSLLIKSDTQVKYDSWLNREYTYNLSNFSKGKFREETVWINNDWENELEKWYGDWRTIKKDIPHIFKKNINLN